MSDRALVQSDEIEKLMEKQRVVGQFHTPAPEFGERSWRINGETFDVVYWDCVNGWATVQQILLRKPGQDTYRRLARLFEGLASVAG